MIKKSSEEAQEMEKKIAREGRTKVKTALMEADRILRAAPPEVGES